MEQIKNVHHLVTYECNMQCNHCHISRNKSNAKPYEFSQEEVKRFYDKFKPGSVSISGGEPLLRIDLVKMILWATESYLSDIEISTNGLLLTSAIVDELQAINPHIRYQISLDGNKHFHDKFRNYPSAYEKAIEAIRLVSSKGIQTKVRMTANDDNFYCIPEMIEHLDSIGNTNISFRIKQLLPLGRAKKNGLSPLSKELTKNLPEMMKTARTIEVMASLGPTPESKCPGILTITPNGDVYPCFFLHHLKEYSLGNIFTDYNALEKVIEDYDTNFQGECLLKRILGDII